MSFLTQSHQVFFGRPVCTSTLEFIAYVAVIAFFMLHYILLLNHTQTHGILLTAVLPGPLRLAFLP